MPNGIVAQRRQHRKPRAELTGTSFGRLTVVSEAAPHQEPSGRSCRHWLCRCECGSVTNVAHADLRSGHTQSCGCLQRERTSASRRRHGLAGAPIYITWRGMKDRCSNTHRADYLYYGGRGITVCDRWNDSFENFLEDMGQPPFEGATIDRIDNDGPYSPENCHWATRMQQQNNTRANRLLAYKGATMSLTQWARTRDMPVSRLRSRLRRGWSIDRALIEAVHMEKVRPQTGQMGPFETTLEEPPMA